VTREPGHDAQVTLKIPRPLYERLKLVIQGSGFHSVTEFAVYVLRDLASHHAEPHKDVEPLAPEEIEQIRKRLESLGYL
jgi:hypothetical protein